MKVLPFQIPKPEKSALIYQVDKAPMFYHHLHQHEEVQISLILEGEGDLIVGDTVNHFKPDDLFVIGSNSPHLFRNNLAEDKDAHMLTLFFTKDSFGQFFFDLLELQELQSVFRKIETGIKVEEYVHDIKSLFLKLESQSHLERLIAFLNILKYISTSKTKSLSSFIYEKVYTDDEGERMSKVMNYAIVHHQEDISLTVISNLANMTPNAFCRYFKRRTNKTFFQFLLEIRLDAACRLLQKNTDLSIAEVCVASGFNNLSNFNRKFKELKEMTPTQFRKEKVLSVKKGSLD